MAKELSNYPRGRRSISTQAWVDVKDAVDTWHSETKGGVDSLEPDEYESLLYFTHRDLTQVELHPFSLWDEHKDQPNFQNIRKLYNERA